MLERPERVKKRKRLNKTKKNLNGPRSHICQRHKETEINAGETELAMKLKKIRKAKKHKNLKNERRQKNGIEISVSKKQQRNGKNQVKRKNEKGQKTTNYKNSMVARKTRKDKNQERQKC